MKRFLWLAGLVIVLLAQPLATLANPHPQSTFTPYKEVWRLGNGWFKDVEWSPDGQTLALSSTLGVYFYDTSYTLIDFWAFPDYLYTSRQLTQGSSLLAWRPDGKAILVSGYNQGSIVFTYPSREILAHLDRQFFYRKPVWSSDSQKIASAAQHPKLDTEMLAIWDVTTNVETPYEDMLGIPFQWLGDRLYIRGYRSVTIWDSQAQQPISEIPVQSSYGIAISPNQKFIAIPDATNARVLDLDSLTTQFTFDFGGHYFTWSPDNSMLVVMTWGEPAHVIDIATQQLIAEIPVNYIFAAWHPSYNSLLVGNGDKFYIWDFRTHEQTLLIENPPYIFDWWLQPRLEQVFDWSPTADSLAVINGPAEIGIWDSKTRQNIQSIKLKGVFPFLEGSYITSIDWNPSRNELLVSGPNANGYLYDLARKAISRIFLGDPLGLVWSPDGSHIAEYYSESVEIYTTGENYRLVTSFEPWVGFSEVTWSPDGKYILLSGGNDQRLVMMYGTASGEFLDTFEGYGPVAWSSDSRHLATTVANQLQIRDIPSGLTTLSQRTEVCKMAWQPSNTIADCKKSIFLWDTTTGELIQTLDGHQGRILQLEWSNDGQWLASASEDTTLRIWGRE